MSEKNTNKILQEVDEEVLGWYSGTVQGEMAYDGEMLLYFDDYMFIKKSKKILLRKKCFIEAEELDYNWFREFIEKNRLEDDVAEMCNVCEKG